MNGYSESHMAVEFYKGEWILRAALPGDMPLASNADAERAMRQWKQRNIEKFNLSDKQR